MEFSKGSNENSKKEKSQKTDWALIFSQMLKHYTGMNIDNLLDLSYPQFKALYSIVFDPRTFNVTIPYLGSNDKNKTEEIKQEENEVTTKEGLMQMIARANAGWK